MGKKPTPVYLAAATKTRAKELAAAAGKTAAEWVLDGLDAMFDEVKASFTPPQERRTSLPPRQRVVRPRAEASSSLQLRLTEEELSAIDAMQVEAGAPSRSALLGRSVELQVALADKDSSRR